MEKQKSSARLTIDMSTEEHMYLKIASAKLGLSMRQFMLMAAFSRVKELKDKQLAKKAQETVRQLEASS